MERLATSSTQARRRTAAAAARIQAPRPAATARAAACRVVCGDKAWCRCARRRSRSRSTPCKGTVTPTATLRVEARDGRAIHQVVNLLGRVRSCSPQGRIAGETRVLRGPGARLGLRPNDGRSALHDERSTAAGGREPPVFDNRDMHHASRSSKAVCRLHVDRADDRGGRRRGSGDRRLPIVSRQRPQESTCRCDSRIEPACNSCRSAFAANSRATRTRWLRCPGRRHATSPERHYVLAVNAASANGYSMTATANASSPQFGDTKCRSLRVAMARRHDRLSRRSMPPATSTPPTPTGAGRDESRCRSLARCQRRAGRRIEA